MTGEIAPLERVLVIGPALLDRYGFGKTERLDRTAPVPVVDITKSVNGLGGAANAVNNLVHMTIPTTFITADGPDCRIRDLLKRLPEELLQTRLVHHPHYRATSKHRLFVNRRLFTRFDVKGNTPPLEDELIEAFRASCNESKPLAILISDYDENFFTPRLIQVILAYASLNKILVVVDPSVKNMRHYKCVDILTPNKAQLFDSMHTDDMKMATSLIMGICNPQQLVVTCGADGMVWVNSEGTKVIPAISAECVDSCGAGDTVAAMLTASIALKLPIDAMQHFSLAAGAEAVRLIGAVPVSLHSVFMQLGACWDNECKRVELAHAEALRVSVGIRKRRFGITNGVFDWLHPGHLQFLKEARSQCDFLLVLVNSDESATRIKRKPLCSCDERVVALCSVPEVDAVVVFDGDSPEAEYNALRPSVLFKAADWENKELPGSAAVKDAGGVVVYLPRSTDSYSTSMLIKSVAERVT